MSRFDNKGGEYLDFDRKFNVDNEAERKKRERYHRVAKELL